MSEGNPADSCLFQRARDPEHQAQEWAGPVRQRGEGEEHGGGQVQA